MSRVKIDPVGKAERHMREIEKTATAISMLDTAIMLMEKISVECSGDEGLQKALDRHVAAFRRDITRQVKRYDRLKGIE